MTERLHFSLFTCTPWRRKWQPTPVFLPGESQGRGSLVGCRLWGRAESDTTEATQQQQIFPQPFFPFHCLHFCTKFQDFVLPTINIFLGLLLFLLHGVLVLIVFFCLVILKLLYSYWFPKILCYHKHDFPTTCVLTFGTRKPLSRGWGWILESG